MSTVQETLRLLNAALDDLDFERAESIMKEFAALDSPTGQCLAIHARAKILSATEHSSRALPLLEEACTLADATHDQYVIAVCHSSLGGALTDEGALRRAYEEHQRSLASYEAIGDKKGSALQYYNIARSLVNAGELAEATTYLRKAIQAFQDLDDPRRLASSLNALGAIYSRSGRINEAVKEYYRALELLQRIGNRRVTAMTLANLATAYYNMDQDDQAMQLYQQSYDISHEIGAFSDAGATLASMTSILSSQGRYLDARQVIERSIALLNDHGNSIDMSWSKNKYCNILINLGALSEARAIISESEPLSDLPPILHREWLLTKADLFIAEDRLSEARSSAADALDITTKVGAVTHLADVHTVLRDIAHKLQDFPAYVHHSTEYQRLTDDVRGAHAIQQLTILEAERAFERERQEHEKQRAVLYSTLPQHIADRVSRGEQVNDHYDNAAVIFLDIVGFTKISEQLSSQQVVQLLDSVFTTLDAVCKKHDVVKIKTIGDSYMAVAFPRYPLASLGASARNDISPAASSGEESGVAERAAYAALEMLDAVSHIVSPLGSPVAVRIGMHCGAVTAGVLGTERLQYDVWGDTVNVASRMESTSEPGKIHVSELFALLLSHGPFLASARNDSSLLAASKEGTVIPNEVRNEEPGTWHLALRGETEVKGKGTMTTYWLISS